MILDGSAHPAEATARLLSLPGIGPWTASYIATRALGDRDAFPVGDLGIRRALSALSGTATTLSVDRPAESWRPWRGYATMHLWTGAT